MLFQYCEKVPTLKLSPAAEACGEGLSGSVRKRRRRFNSMELCSGNLCHKLTLELDTFYSILFDS